MISNIHRVYVGTAMNAHIKPTNIMSLWNLLRIDISEQHSYFFSLCVLVGYYYQMATDPHLLNKPAYMHTDLVPHRTTMLWVGIHNPALLLINNPWRSHIKTHSNTPDVTVQHRVISLSYLLVAPGIPYKWQSK